MIGVAKPGPRGPRGDRAMSATPAHSFAATDALEEPSRPATGGAPASRARSDEVLLAVENVSLGFGGVKALTDVSFDIRKGEIRAIIGPNGAGKTSMLNCINGFYPPHRRPHHLQGRDPAEDAALRGGGRRHRAHRSRTWRCSRACRRSTTS